MRARTARDLRRSLERGGWTCHHARHRSRDRGATEVREAVPLVDVRAAYLAQQAELDAAVAGVVDSGGFILGPEVEGFEAEFAGFCGAPPAGWWSQGDGRRPHDA